MKTVILIICAVAVICHSQKTCKIQNEFRLLSMKQHDSLSHRIFGYRFVIEGDFDGDGKKEKLAERLISLKDNKETDKYFITEEPWEAIDSVIANRNYSFLISDNLKIDTLRVGREGQVYGVSLLRNEGDLNGDGTDEVSYVGDWADYSSLNSWHIMTYKNNSWQELYSFGIWDWQLPDLPEATNQYGLFGTEGKVAVNDTLNQKLERDLLQWKGFVKKIKPNKIQITYRTDEAEIDSMTVNLKHPKKASKF
ncbi:hypothetical protein [Flavobacterium pallidum]|uniref:Uncharacterized protein n=1 Tax=Flavobacterium pallidum TaxID=2172098 RepID=A0A2S1SEU6_9FLAO|nr:hypothetical protein [Flavobacterium pallidum]AWI24877.1 hypothetical protein HYN49_02645 [Flavobacterium pallidum]